VITFRERRLYDEMTYDGTVFWWNSILNAKKQVNY
jgi:hypothetical protein